MAKVAADLRSATVAVLRSWCHDFGLKPHAKKDDVVQQLCSHFRIDLRAAQEEAEHVRHLEEVPIAVVRRRCRVKTREEDSLVPPVIAVKLPENRKRKLSTDTGVRTRPVRCDTQSPQELRAQSKTDEKWFRQQPESKKCKAEHVQRARSLKEVIEQWQADNAPNWNLELKANYANERVRHRKQLDVNFENGTTNVQFRQETVAYRPHEPDAQREKETECALKKAVAKHRKGKTLAQHQRRSEQQTWPRDQQCQELLHQCDEEAIYPCQGLEAGHKKQEEDADRQEALQKGKEAKRQEAEDECSEDEENTCCRQELDKQRPITEANLDALNVHDKLHIGFKSEVGSRKDYGHERSLPDLGELRHQEFEIGCHHDIEQAQSSCKQEESQLQALKEAGWRDLALAATPNKRTRDAGRQWRNQWSRLSLLPAPEVPCSLSPLPGGDVWAAVEMRRAAEEEGSKSAAASPAPRSPPAWPSVSKVEDKEPLKTGDHFEDSEPSFNYGQMPISQAAKKLVALSVAAAEMDETARCGRLVDLATGMIHSLPDDGIVAIGRSTGCNIVLAFPIIDNRHCVLLCNEGRVVVEDVGSKETFVNEMLVPRGDFLPQRVPLLRGDTLALAHPDGPKFLFLDGVRQTASSFGGA